MSNGILYSLLIIAIGYSISECSLLRYQIAAASGNRQYGAILLYGALYAVGWAAFTAFLFVPNAFASEEGITAVYNFVTSHSIAILSTGVISALFIRFVIDVCCYKFEQELVIRANRHQGDELNLLLLDSMDRSVPVLLTLDSGKLYIGWVKSTPNPLDDREHQYIRIFPLRSGYRDEKQKDILITDYEHLYDAGGYEKDTDFEEVIPRKSIKSANLFDIRFSRGDFSH